MQTSVIDELRNTVEGQEADRILRSCTHCGFCTATCPTYQLLGDERDSPRGRIYLMKQIVEGQIPTEKTQLHLDRCLTCRACETTCPSGVEYAKLLDISRTMVEEQVSRPLSTRMFRRLLRLVVPHRRRFAFFLGLGRTFKPLMVGPLAGLKSQVPARQQPSGWPDAGQFNRKMLILDGCVQPSAAPNTNAATARLLARFDIGVVAAEQAGCCGALSRHLAAGDEADDYARANIDAWWPHIEAGAEAIVTTASGCGAEVAEYGYLLRNDPDYSDKAAKVSELTRDLSDIVAEEDLDQLKGVGQGRRIAFHPPCTLQNAPALKDHVAEILAHAGFELTPVTNKHLCCGSAGTYSILQPELAGQLRRDKLANLTAGAPERIVTANIGCQMHLDSGGETPVNHWVELLDGERSL